MSREYKFRAILKTDKFQIMVVPDSVRDTQYYIDIDEAERAFVEKYPKECFWDFIEEIEKQDYIQEVSVDCNIIITRNLDNLMQATGIYDNTKFKDLTEQQQSDWLKEHKVEDWHGIEIYEEDVVAIKYSKDIIDYGVVDYYDGAYSKGSCALSSYKKQTKIVGNIHEEYPAKAIYTVENYLKFKEEGK